MEKDYLEESEREAEERSVTSSGFNEGFQGHLSETKWFKNLGEYPGGHINFESHWRVTTIFVNPNYHGN